MYRLFIRLFIRLFFILSVSLTSTVSYADFSIVPLPDNTKVHMQLDDNYPKIFTGFVQLSDSEVMSFYISQLGEPDKTIEDIGRYTYYYEIEGKQVKISIYQHDHEYCEINIMITEN